MLGSSGVSTQAATDTLFPHLGLVGACLPASQAQPHGCLILFRGEAGAQGRRERLLGRLLSEGAPSLQAACPEGCQVG